MHAIDTSDSLFADWPRPLAFVLSGGGAFGSVQVGMLQALQSRGVIPDLVVGTSVGSLHGAVVASGADDPVETLAALWHGMNRRSLFGGRRTVLSSAVRTRTLSNFDRLGQLIDEHLPGVKIEDLALPFAAVATDVLTGEPELLRSGPVKDALLASSAVPGFFPPVEFNGRVFVDGGIAANVPLRQAIAFGARSMISLDATPSLVASQVPRTFAGRLLHSASLMARSQRSSAVDEIAHRYPIAVMPSATPPDMGSFNFSRTAELIASSYELSLAALDGWTIDVSVTRDRSAPVRIRSTVATAALHDELNHRA